MEVNSQVNVGVCVGCGGKISLFGPSGSYRYFRCHECGTLQLEPLPDGKTLEKLYAEHYASLPQTEEFGNPEVWDKVARNYHISVLRALKAHLKSGLVVDIGAGWGGLVRMLQESGYQCLGVEKNRDEVRYARSCGLPVIEGGLEQVEDKAGQIEAFTLCAVWEHLVEHGAWLTKVNRLLKPGGVIVTLHPTARLYTLIATLLRLGKVDKPIPDFDATFYAPWHTVIFSVAGTKLLAEKYGFECIDLRPSLQGRRPGMMGLIQIALETVNRIGWACCGARWPLVTTHVFVLRKCRDV